jgi:hypothetical protein
MTKYFFQTEKDRQQWDEFVANLEVKDLPSEYQSDEFSSEDTEDFSDEELEDLMKDLVVTESDQKDMGDYKYDSSIKSIEFMDKGFKVDGLFSDSFEDLFYHVQITKGDKVVYLNDYGKETHNNNEISDDQVDEYLDQLITYAMDADSDLHESFIVEAKSEDDPCWDDYEMIGTKKKNGKDVPNCVPVNESLEDLRKKKIEIEDKMDKINKSGGKILMNDPLKKQYDKIVADIKKLKSTQIKEAEELEEISKKKIDNYLDRSVRDHGMASFASRQTTGKEQEHWKNIARKRKSGISKAYDILDKKVNEELDEDVSVLNQIKNTKKDQKIKFKDGSTVEVAADEARIILKKLEELEGEEKKKFENMLSKNQQSFLMAYRIAYK